MLEATLVTMGWAVSNWLIAGVHHAHGQREHDGGTSGAFRTGRGLLNIAANKQEQFEELARLSAGRISSPIPASPTARTARPTVTS